ncbi:putative hemolysin [Kribbella orskensis]|uniref:Hemolysin n=1 Tax=Kribbella orskensis TaxID=2512216 RepID=A0ABY2BW53_9ACTN|nr:MULTISPECIES: hemolysin family protein [Kribbella]TCN44015.1 putative hemolysin [Kribbella sp. VKM Ac-2500]TCO32207.1 putative hemolysin [Kribbella orskensis]
MNQTLLNIVLIFIFVLIGGVFAAAEMALVSLRESQLKSISQRGRRGETVARVAANPNRFLSAVQIGVTLMGFLSAAFGGATLADGLAPHLQDLGLPESVANTVALVLITIAISYVSIVVGELAAKRLALQRAETFALGLAPLVDRIASIARPVIWLLSRSTDLVVRALGGDPNANREVMSDEELREIVSAHESLGEEERRIVDDVFEAGGRQLRELMLPRTEVDFVDAEMPAYKAVKFAAERPHSRYPVMNGSADDIVGFVHVRDLFDPAVASRSVRVGDLARDVLMLPDTAKLLPTLTEMRRRSTHLAIVLDEYGGTAGIVTLEDLVEELIGDIKDEYDDESAETTRLRSGDVEVDGLLNLDDFADETGVELPDGPYETVAGWLAAQLGRVPAVGDEAQFDGYKMTVTKMDGRRVARVRVHRVVADEPLPETVAGTVVVTE